MNRMTALALVTLATLSSIGAASAQDRGLRATVPFEFTVGTRLLPADTYRVTVISAGLIRLQNRDGHFAAATTTFMDAKQSPNGSKLVFTKHGNQYFLREILCPTNPGMNVAIPPSKLEKRVERQEAMLHGGEPVLIAAR
ncbi:hypothetical protein ACPOL_4119 [Acidisarcina polymorpha]|uniref:EfeO-type cupredoxin-like domain-containing protein n=1 Tax=Acidisarcina polymorpha TaxID=2211140 RepID=A0A2Z5G4F2_9BACT|nr:hypothetical protein [Acidisarcina polymorpha]AXC13396.1 hypothetical protein ACPOL_4119 [Acidisarcina polymorpha]